MELKECVTCGSHSFTDNKCDYCGNKYEAIDDIQDKLIYGNTYYDDGTEYYSEKEVTKIDFQETPEGKKMLKVMIFILVSVIWFAVCVFVPPLFIITICGLIILMCRKVCKKY